MSNHNFEHAAALLRGDVQAGPHELTLAAMQMQALGFNPRGVARLTKAQLAAVAFALSSPAPPVKAGAERVLGILSWTRP